MESSYDSDDFQRTFEPVVIINDGSDEDQVNNIYSEII